MAKSSQFHKSAEEWVSDQLTSMGQEMCLSGLISGRDCFLQSMNFYNPERGIRFRSLWLDTKTGRILRLLDLVLFLVIHVLFLPAVFSLRPVITLASNKQSAGKQNTKD